MLMPNWAEAPTSRVNFSLLHHVLGMRNRLGFVIGPLFQQALEAALGLHHVPLGEQQLAM
jgi:hypothetical protein